MSASFNDRQVLPIMPSLYSKKAQNGSWLDVVFTRWRWRCVCVSVCVCLCVCVCVCVWSQCDTQCKPDAYLGLSGVCYICVCLRHVCVCVSTCTLTRPY